MCFSVHPSEKHNFSRRDRNRSRRMPGAIVFKWFAACKYRRRGWWLEIE
jgi:hypothetical protein